MFMKQILFLTNVPKIHPYTHEVKYALISKVFFHLRHTRRCSSIIRSDMIDAQRFSLPNSNVDIVEFCLTTPILAVEHINLEQRIAEHDVPLPKTDIALRLHFPSSSIVTCPKTDSKSLSNLSDID